MYPIKGALSGNAASKWNWNNFMDCERPKKRFAEGFRLAYGKLVASTVSVCECESNAEEKEQSEKTEEEKKKVAASASSGPTKDEKLMTFRQDCEAYVDRELQARLVVLTNDGQHPELHNAVTGCRLYHNLPGLVQDSWASTT